LGLGKLRLRVVPAEDIMRGIPVWINIAVVSVAHVFENYYKLFNY